MNLPKLELMFLTFRLTARETVVLPPFLGSTLRGAFGTALKQVFCFVPGGDCERCWFFETCPYQYVFESPNLIPSEANHPKLRGLKNLPHPFVLIAPAPRPNGVKSAAAKPDFDEEFAENHFSYGAELRFSILLLGKATRFWAQILVAARLLAENGLGNNRAPFVLRQAFAHDGRGQTLEIFNEETNRVSGKYVASVALDWLAETRAASLANELKNELRIEFETPARIRIADRINADFSAADLLKKITERIEFLARIHAETSEKFDYREFIAGADDVLKLKNRVKIYRCQQHSNRQRKKIPRDVMTAEITLSGGEISRFLPVLAAGEILQIGADTSRSFGRFVIKI